jgi:hypothetical protein
MDKGIPLYKDKQKRKIVDSIDPFDKNLDWYPSNKAALILWHCLESLRDILLGLENCYRIEEIAKRKRIIKNISIPLHSLANSIVDLCNNLTSNVENRIYINNQKINEILKVNNLFQDIFSLSHKSDISRLRNKLAAHIDKNISPKEANDILKSNESIIGNGIHICCHILIDLLNVDVYAWCCEIPNHSTFNIMTNEPWLVCLDMEGHRPKRIKCIHAIEYLPLENIIDIIKRIDYSQFLFSKSDIRLRGISFNSEGNKLPFLAAGRLYKKI